MNELFLIAVNLTRRCNLACDHCYLDAETLRTPDADELGTEEVCNLLSSIAQRNPAAMVVLTGGEPLLRRDLEVLTSHGSRLGLAMVIGTNGLALTDNRVQALQGAGAIGMGISLDSLDPARHDAFRGLAGSWEKTLAGMEACRRHGLPFQVHFSVTQTNADEIPAMIAFARSVGAHVLNVFFLVCTGRGESMTDISPQRYEQVLKELVEAQEQTTDLIIRARCAPHFKRIAYQHDPESRLTRAQGYEGGGCLAGTHYCRITPEGAVTVCPYIPDSEGNIRETPFWEIWDDSPTFRELRTPRLNGKCGECEFQKLCGGCRARPKALGGSLMDTDSWCVYEPVGAPTITPLAELTGAEIRWSTQAERRLERVPGFLRKMVRKRAEDHVRQLGESIVTPVHLATLASRRFGNSPPGAGKTQPVERDSRSFPWTSEADDYLQEIPSFLREGVREVAESVARDEGRLEVNTKLIRRLEEDDSPARTLPWGEQAELRLKEVLAVRAPQVRAFLQPTIESAAEREAKQRGASVVGAEDVDLVTDTDTAGVNWDPEALRRVETAPDFIRAGIKKAAEFNARREGLETIACEDLTRFRNRAMMRAVRRMKGFGMRELDFNAFDIAKERVPRLKDNPQAARRFATIRDYVEGRQQAGGEGLGVMDRDLIEKMKTELKNNPRGKS